MWRSWGMHFALVWVIGLAGGKLLGWEVVKDTSWVFALFPFWFPLLLHTSCNYLIVMLEAARKGSDQQEELSAHLSVILQKLEKSIDDISSKENDQNMKHTKEKGDLH